MYELLMNQSIKRTFGKNLSDDKLFCIRYGLNNGVSPKRLELLSRHSISDEVASSLVDLMITNKVSHNTLKNIVQDYPMFSGLQIETVARAYTLHLENEIIGLIQDSTEEVSCDYLSSLMDLYEASGHSRSIFIEAIEKCFTYKELRHLVYAFRECDMSKNQIALIMSSELSIIQREFVYNMYVHKMYMVDIKNILDICKTEESLTRILEAKVNYRLSNKKIIRYFLTDEMDYEYFISICNGLHHKIEYEIIDIVHNHFQTKLERNQALRNLKEFNTKDRKEILDMVISEELQPFVIEHLNLFRGSKLDRRTRLTIIHKFTESKALNKALIDLVNDGMYIDELSTVINCIPDHEAIGVNYLLELRHITRFESSMLKLIPLLFISDEKSVVLGILHEIKCGVSRESILSAVSSSKGNLWKLSKKLNKLRYKTIKNKLNTYCTEQDSKLF